VYSNGPLSSAFTTVDPKTGTSVKAGATTPRAATDSKETPSLVTLFVFIISSLGM